MQQAESIVSLRSDYEAECRALEHVIAWCLGKMGVADGDVRIVYTEDDGMLSVEAWGRGDRRWGLRSAGSLTDFAARFRLLHSLALNLTLSASKSIQDVCDVMAEHRARESKPSAVGTPRAE